MPPHCDLCGTKKVPAEENTYVCPTCGKETKENPPICDYCHEHVACVPSSNEKWICDNCILKTIIGPEAFEQVLAIQTRLLEESGQPVSLGDAFAAWRALSTATKVTPGFPASEVNAHAT